MKKLKFLLCNCMVCAIPFASFAQAFSPDTAVISQIKKEEYNHSQIPLIAHYLTDVSGPRLTNSTGFKTASLWATQILNTWGLSNVKLEQWGEFGKGWDVKQYEMAMSVPFYKIINGYPRAWTIGTGGPVTAEIMLLTKLDSSSLQQMASEIKGKILLISSPNSSLQPASEYVSKRYADSVLSKLPETDMVSKEMIPYLISEYLKRIRLEKQLKRLGAVALLSTNRTSRDGTFVIDGTQSFKPNSKPTLPQVAITKEDYMMFQRLLNDGKKVVVNLNVDVKWETEDLNGYNVIAEIPGSDPKLKGQVVMIGAHLDSWHVATGATDNAAGCAVMMEVLRIFQTLNLHPRRTIRLALWSGEEQALLGSFGYVKKHFGDPANMDLSNETKNVSAYYNLDNGSGKIRGIYLQNNEAVRSVFKSWLAPFNDLQATGITLSNTGSTDHLSFDAVGIPAFQFIQDPLDYDYRTHHSNMDLYDHLQFDDLKQSAIIITSFVYNTAQRDELLPRKPLPKAEKFIFDIDLDHLK